MAHVGGGSCSLATCVAGANYYDIVFRKHGVVFSLSTKLTIGSRNSAIVATTYVEMSLFHVEQSNLKIGT